MCAIMVHFLRILIKSRPPVVTEGAVAKGTITIGNHTHDIMGQVNVFMLVRLPKVNSQNSHNMIHCHRGGASFSSYHVFLFVGHVIRQRVHNTFVQASCPRVTRFSELVHTRSRNHIHANNPSRRRTRNNHGQSRCPAMKFRNTLLLLGLQWFSFRACTRCHRVPS